MIQSANLFKEIHFSNSRSLFAVNKKLIVYKQTLLVRTSHNRILQDMKRM